MSSGFKDTLSLWYTFLHVKLPVAFGVNRHCDQKSVFYNTVIANDLQKRVVFSSSENRTKIFIVVNKIIS